MILEDYNYDGPDFQPWDPRIKDIAIMHNQMEMNFTFIVYLHCQRKVAWAISEEFAAQTSTTHVRDLIQSAVQPLIDDEYKKRQEMAGGAVDIFGKPMVKLDGDFLPLLNEGKLEAFSTGVIPIQMTPEEQFETWLKQADSIKSGQVYTSVPGEGQWVFSGLTSEGFTLNPTVDTGHIVQRNLKKLFPALKELVSCPECAKLEVVNAAVTLDKMIIHLNDTHEWSRETVADWLESLDIDLEMKENV